MAFRNPAAGIPVDEHAIPTGRMFVPGKQSLASFLKEAEAVWSARRFHPMTWAANLRLVLPAELMDEYDEIAYRHGVNANYAILKSELIKRVDKPPSVGQLVEQLRSIRQKPEQPVEEFIAEIARQGRKLMEAEMTNEEVETKMKSTLIAGLMNNNHSEELVKANHDEPMTWPAACVKIRRLQSIADEVANHKSQANQANRLKELEEQLRQERVRRERAEREAARVETEWRKNTELLQQMDAYFQTTIANQQRPQFQTPSAMSQPVSATPQAAQPIRQYGPTPTYAYQQGRNTPNTVPVVNQAASASVPAVTPINAPPVANSRSQTPANTTGCYECGHPGHSSKFCSQRNPALPANSCFRCGDPTHTRRNCPLSRGNAPANPLE